jgi:hypothetical protein
VYGTNFNLTMSQAVVTIQLRRQSSYYTIMFIMPSTMMTMLALFGMLEEFVQLATNRKKKHEI